MPKLTVTLDDLMAVGLENGPEAAFEFLNSKSIQTTWSWQEMWQDAHSRATTVAGVTKMDVLQEIHNGLKDALKNGKTQQQFANELTPFLQKKGWWGRDAQVDKETGEITGKGLTPSRLKLVYQQNMQTAFMVGRYREMKSYADTHPYWQYVAVMDGRTRPAHAALHGRVFRHDDPIWSAIYPPNGFRCRCRVRPMSDLHLQRESLAVTDSTEYTSEIQVPISARHPEMGMTTVTRFKMPEMPVGFQPDPGFSYNPATPGRNYGGDLLLVKAAQTEPVIAAQAVHQTLTLKPDSLQKLTDDFSAWADAVAESGRGSGHIIAAAAVAPTVVQKLTDRNIMITGAVMAVRDDDVIHAHRDTKKDAVHWSWYRQLPKHLAQPRAVLLDLLKPKAPALVYVFIVDGHSMKMVVNLEYKSREWLDGRRTRLVYNDIRTGAFVPLDNIYQDRELLWGATEEELRKELKP